MSRHGAYLRELIQGLEKEAALPAKYVPRFRDLLKGLVSKPQQITATKGLTQGAKSSILTPGRAFGQMVEHHPKTTAALGLGTGYLGLKALRGGGDKRPTQVIHY
jgi:hypothetical protein